MARDAGKTPTARVGYQRAWPLIATSLVSWAADRGCRAISPSVSSTPRRAATLNWSHAIARSPHGGGGRHDRLGDRRSGLWGAHAALRVPTRVAAQVRHWEGFRTGAAR